ncbi:hypothetical protein Tsubulata_012348 [Turnera subulata]|uniref:Uncharacterized protein n=1 Tax=Turnera subulata TaxID=218843 RepID=A0A9Q0F1U2_9ROSI|nr:hypothetical protein Tsubulata_012348 [Turnera subulata]
MMGAGESREEQKLFQLYVVGGDIKIPSSFPSASQRLQTVRSLDLSSCRVWVRKPPMLLPRRKPSVVAVGGKLYVLGGVSDSGRHPWGEVYDPGSNTWEAFLILHSFPNSGSCRRG